MNNKQKVSLNIWLFVFFSGILFLIISIYFYQDYSSIKLFFTEFFIRKINIVLLFWVAFLSFLSWLFSYLIINNIFTNIEEYNNKLKDYNHFLAHELKTPISVINSNLEVLKYGFDEEKINNSKSELKNITKIIDWLLDFSESFSSLNKVEINVENFIKSSLNFNKLKSKINIINKEFNFSIITDELLFERVIKNLVDNALKYSPDQEVNIYIKNDKLIFKNTIYKNLNREELDKIFNKFYTSTCNENTWSWIWLPIIKEITKALWYELKISSNDNKFIVEIIF